MINDFTVLSGGSIAFFISGSNKAAIDAVTGSITVFYNKSTNFQTRGDFEDAPNDTPTPFSNPNAASATEIVIPEINVQMKSETISAKTRKLKAQWTPEFAQDLNAYHSLDAEAELTGMLSEYISLEMTWKSLICLSKTLKPLLTGLLKSVTKSILPVLPTQATLLVLITTKCLGSKL